MSEINNLCMGGSTESIRTNFFELGVGFTMAFARACAFVMVRLV